MTEFIVLIILFILEYFYFKIANKFNIIDKPNERSSHSQVTIRGGGIIFYFAAIIFFIISDFSYIWFYLGLTLMTIISFLDDIFTLSNRLRLAIHFGSVLLMTYQLGIFSFPWYYLLITFVIIVGVINAYNFMDGINGITAIYSLSVAGLLLIVNREINFVNEDFLIFPIIGLLVFGFFNFRNKAKCFAGDVGSVSIAYILLFALGLLIVKTENLIYILFLLLYGIDTIWTIIRRLILGENIFKAHRSHLYQFLVNEAKYNKLIISALYGIIQFVIGVMIIWLSNKDYKLQIIFSGVLILSTSLVYLIVKRYVINRFVLNNEEV